MKNPEAGFTLIEMITVIALIATMLAFSIPNLRDGRTRQSVKHDARQFASDLAFAQSQTLAQKVYDTNQQTVHPFGVYVNKSTKQYTVFEDMNNNARFDDPALVPTSADSIFNRVGFQGDVELKNISFGNELPTQFQDLTVFFAAVSDEGASAGSPSCSSPIDCTQKVYFQFGSSRVPETVSVVLNPSGLIQKP